jgi:hypothetical protein
MLILLFLIIIVLLIIHFNYRVEFAFLVGYGKGYSSKEYKPDKAHTEFKEGDYY